MKSKLFSSFFQPHVGKVTRFASCISIFFGQECSSSFHSFGFVPGCKRGIHLLMAILAGSHMAKPMEFCIFSHQKVTRSSRRLERAFAYDEYEEEVQFSGLGKIWVILSCGDQQLVGQYFRNSWRFNFCIPPVFQTHWVPQMDIKKQMASFFKRGNKKKNHWVRWFCRRFNLQTPAIAMGGIFMAQIPFCVSLWLWLTVCHGKWPIEIDGLPWFTY